LPAQTAVDIRQRLSFEERAKPSQRVRRALWIGMFRPDILRVQRQNLSDRNLIG